jgi:2-polyprenyl-3-methyl-5-hydroxy-6-metoxy-1,4-benzoquinol methylase
LLQRWRIVRAARWLPDGARVLDIGCFDASLFERLAARGVHGVGIDPLLDSPIEGPNYTLRPGRFPEDVPVGDRFGAIVALAVVEHLPEAVLPELGRACAALLCPRGRLIVTVPSPVVDRILDVLVTLRLVDGMSLEEHHGFDPRTTPQVVTRDDLRLIRRQRFQLGLNHLFVFEKT